MEVHVRDRKVQVFSAFTQRQILMLWWNYLQTALKMRDKVKECTQTARVCDVCIIPEHVSD